MPDKPIAGPIDASRNPFGHLSVDHANAQRHREAFKAQQAERHKQILAERKAQREAVKKRRSNSR